MNGIIWRGAWLWNDAELREICDIEAREKPCYPSQLTWFRRIVGPERLERVMSRRTPRQAKE